jgi:hypothetical protein
MKWRWPTWVFIVWTVLMVLWVFAGVRSADCASSTYEGACNAGLGIGIFIILFIWFLVATPLSIIWYATKPKGRVCPACGRQVPEGYVACSCGYNFAAAAGLPPGGQVPQCWRCRAPIGFRQTPCPRCGAAINW